MSASRLDPTGLSAIGPGVRPPRCRRTAAPAFRGTALGPVPAAAACRTSARAVTTRNRSPRPCSRTPAVCCASGWRPCSLAGCIHHTWTHRLLTEASAEGTRRELVLLQERVRELTGRAPTLMRPPRGLTNPSVAEVCRSLGLAQILWSVTAKDYRDHDPEVITSRVLQGAQRNGIILLHDVYPVTLPAVPGIIDGLRRRGLTPVTVSQLFAPHRPEPGQTYRNAPSA
ncbi:polysaccharide deacetylase family protein [Streptomyces sp. KS 21]|uniref:polysaccharide deacetylase family protein n=1 Tax=Streptomyces sp. KS 21 TaxID=2485150 RepID=UPI0010636070|nr:polysaccharide deacetylase family protein [Streptomyces sp. KS 21]